MVQPTQGAFSATFRVIADMATVASDPPIVRHSPKPRIEGETALPSFPMVVSDLERVCLVGLNVVNGPSVLPLLVGRDAAEPDLKNVRILVQNFPRGRNKTSVAKNPIVFAVKNIICFDLFVGFVDGVDLASAGAVGDPLGVVPG